MLGDTMKAPLLKQELSVKQRVWNKISAKTRDVTTHKRDSDPAVTNSSRTVMEKCPQTTINQDKCQFGTNQAHSGYCQHRTRSVAYIEHDAGKTR
jgi:hypothetical protein